MQSNTVESKTVEPQSDSIDQEVLPTPTSSGAHKSGTGERTRSLKILVLMLLALSFFGLGSWIHELSKMPRERAQRNFNYFERVWYGFNMWSRMLALASQASPDPFPNTLLPVIELKIDSNTWNSFVSNLPKSGTEARSIQVSLPGLKDVPALARITGISINHWGMPWKSWNVKLQKEKFQGLSNFNLMMPRSNTQFENWLGNEMSRKLGKILTPHSEFVHVRLNGTLNGVRLLLEPVTPEFAIRRELPAGKLFHGDITTEQIYDGVPRERLFSQADAWKVNLVLSDQETSNTVHNDNKEIAALNNIVQRVHNPYDFFNRITELVNMPAMLSYMALLDIVSSVHIDETHNWKMYWNSETGLLEPIVWNSVAYYWKNTKSIDLTPNDLFRVIIGNPGFREDKDRIIWEAINGELSEHKLLELVRSEAERVRPDLYASYLKWGAGDKGIRLLSNSDWETALLELERVIRERHNFFRNTLRASDVSYRVLQKESNLALLAIKVSSRSGVKLDSIVLSLNSRGAGFPIVVNRRGLNDIKGQIRPDRIRVRATSSNDGLATLEIKDLLTSKRRVQRRRPVEVVPSTYIYEINLPVGIQIDTIKAINATNSVTGERIQLINDESLEIADLHVPNIVWWEPRDFVRN